MTPTWQLGRVLILRHAGMPFDWVEELGAAPALNAASEEVIRSERDLLDIVADSADAECVRDAIDRADPSRLSAKPSDAWRVAFNVWATAVDAYKDAFATGDRQADAALRHRMRNDVVRHAVWLSNPDVYHNMLRPYLDHGGPLNARWRRVRRQMYTYLQRFCAKNETVSFFGPQAYGTVIDGPTMLDTSVRRRRRVFVSAWAVRALVRTLSKDRELFGYLPIATTGRPAGNVAPDVVKLLVGVANGGTVREVQRRCGLIGVAFSRAIADALHDGLIDFALGGGPYDEEPLPRLIAQLGALPDTPPRNVWRERLARLESLRTSFESTEQLENRITLLAELEQLFSAITGAPARRGAGANYADRAIIFEECASPFALRIGSDTARSWENALAGALEICAAHGDATQRAAAAQVHAVLGDVRMSLQDYALRLADAYSSEQGSSFESDHAPVYDGAEWQARVSALADAAVALPEERYAVIDLCLRASGPDEVDSAALVLARTHHHLLVRSWLATMHPDPDSFAADAATWVRQQPHLVGLDFGRRNKGYYRFPGPEIALRSPSWTDRDREDLMWPEAQTVEVTSDSVRLWNGDQELRAYVPLSDFVKYAPYSALAHPQVLHPSFVSDDDVPEVKVDGVVLQRSRWHVDPEQLTQSTPEARYLALRRVAARTGLRFVFCRTDQERKPYLIDLASPLAGDLLAHVARHASTITAEAMVPGPDGLWLRDEEGRRYTCELRAQVIRHVA